MPPANDGQLQRVGPSAIAMTGPRMVQSRRGGLHSRTMYVQYFPLSQPCSHTSGTHLLLPLQEEPPTPVLPSLRRSPVKDNRFQALERQLELLSGHVVSMAQASNKQQEQLMRQRVQDLQRQRKIEHEVW